MTETAPGREEDRAPTVGERGAARRRALAGAVVTGLALVGAACGSSTTSSTTRSSTTAATAPASTTATAGSASTTPGTTVPGAVVVDASSRGTVGVVLVDGVGGPTLYRYTPDGTGPSTCSAACAQAWPPLTVPSASAVSPGTGLAATALGTVPRSDGTLQVTYRGMPLYRFAGDAHPTQTSGQGVGGVWYVVHPAGPAEASAGATTTTTRAKAAPY